jgi:hypothetical protein
VLEDYEIEDGVELKCNFSKKKGREELINASKLILVDEVSTKPSFNNFT